MFRIPYVISKKGETVSNLITWEIPKIREVIKKGQELRAECTNQDNLDDYNFQLKLEILDRNTKMIDVFFLCRNKVYLKSVEWINPEFNDDDEQIKWQDYMQCIIQPYKWHLLNSCPIVSIQAYLYKDLLSIELKFTMIDYTEIDNNIIVPESEMHNDFGNLLRRSSFSDAIMKSVDGEEYKIHKAFVTSRSVVLKAHFEHNTTESLTNVILSPFDSAVLKEVLNFIYTDRAPKVDDMPEKLLAAADFYQLNRLKGLAEVALYKKLTVENAMEYLELADLHSCKQLRETIQEFITDGRSKAIIQTEGWAKVKSLELVKGLMECIVLNEQ